MWTDENGNEWQWGCSSIVIFNVCTFKLRQLFTSCSSWFYMQPWEMNTTKTKPNRTQIKQLIDMAHVYFMWTFIQVNGVLTIIYNYAPCISSCLPDQTDCIASQLFLPACIAYSQKKKTCRQITEIQHKWSAMLKSIKGTRLKWIGCCESTATGNILACVRQWDSEVGSAVSLSWRLSSQIRSRMTQLSQVLQHRDWLQSTPGLAASDHTGTTGKGFLCSCEAIWHRALCTVEGAHTQRVWQR